MTANFISEIHEDAFQRLPQLEELVLCDNRIRQLPKLPPTLTFIDVSKNRLGRKGIRNEAFKVSLGLMGKYFLPLWSEEDVVRRPAQASLSSSKTIKIIDTMTVLAAEKSVKMEQEV